MLKSIRFKCKHSHQLLRTAITAGLETFEYLFYLILVNLRVVQKVFFPIGHQKWPKTGLDSQLFFDYADILFQTRNSL